MLIKRLQDNLSHQDAGETKSETAFFGTF